MPRPTSLILCLALTGCLALTLCLACASPGGSLSDAPAGSLSDAPPGSPTVPAEGHGEDADPPQAAAGPGAPTHEDLDSTLWVQTSAEYGALTRQIFQLATLRLEEALADPAWTAALEQEATAGAGLPPAVIVDVDETVLDNSPFQARLVVEGTDFSGPRWQAWVSKAEAEPVPGAGDFLAHAQARGVTVFYVTNRDHQLEKATRANLLAVGFPVDASRDVVLTSGEHGWNSDKSPRRGEVAKTHRILLLVGDDLNDFVAGARAKAPEPRRELAEENRERWGRGWILLPNPQYGSWEASLIARDFNMPYGDKLRRKYGYLRPFEDAAPVH